MKKKKLNWNNLLTLIVFVLSIAFILYDICVLMVATFMGKMAGWTWFGFITFIVCWIFASWSYEDLKDAVNKKRNKAR